MSIFQTDEPMNLSIKKQTLFQIFILTAAFLVVYQKAILKLISDWSTDPNFSHGFLIPFVALYMIWYKKNELAEVSFKPSLAGIIVIIGGVLIPGAGKRGSAVFFLRRFLRDSP